MAYIGFGPLNTFSPVPSKDSFTGDGSTTTFDLENEVVFGGENALEVFVDNVRQEPGTGKAYTLDLDGNLKNKRITFSAAPASGAAIYVINDKTSNTTIISPTDLNGVEFILDADADTSITADTDDRIDFKLNGTDHIQLGTSSGDTTIKIATDAKDLQFLQADGRNILEINDAGYVALGNGATGSGQLRIYEDTDNGTNFSAFQVGTQSADITYTLPTADGTSGFQLTTNGSGVLSWAAAQIALANDGNNRIVTGTGSAGLNAEAGLTYDGSTLAVTGAVTVSTDVTIQDDLILDSDAAVLSFGEDNEITLTHVADTGLLLNTASVIQFRDSAINIGSPADGDLDINADDEIELNSTLVDINANVDISGTLTLGGNLIVGSATVTEAQLEILDGATVSTTELNLLDGKAATNLALLGKTEGTNFSGSLLVGHATSGTLSSAEHNTGVGTTALSSLTTGDKNTAVGNGAGTAITTSVENTAVGRNALRFVATGGGRNTAIGVDALTANANFVENTAIGRTALTACTGDVNIGIGYNAGANITSGSGNVMIGEVNADSATGDRQLKITGNDGSTSTTWISGDSSGNLTFAGDVTVGDDLNLTTDASVINFGADSDVVLTHVADTGLLLNTASVIQFRDSAINIGSPADGDLDINADDEIELNSTLVDLNGNLDVSGTIVGASTISGTTITATTAFVPDASDGAALGTTSLEFSDLFLADGAVIGLGDDQEVTLTHVADTGITLNSTNKLMFNDASQFIQGASATVLDIAATDEIELTATLIEVVGNATVSGTLGVTGVLTADAGVAVDNITIDGTEIDLSSGDLTVDVAGDIVLDAGGGNVKIAVGGTDILDIANSSSDVIIKPVVDAKDIIFQQRDGTEVARIEDNATFNVVTGKLAINGTAVTSTAAELNKLDGVGTLKQAGKETMWVPSSAMYGATNNPADPQQVETTAGRPDMKVLDFDPGTVENAHFSIAFPKSWNEGTVTYQVYWAPSNTNTGNCIFRLGGVSCGDNDTIDVAFGTPIDVVDAGIGTVEDQQVSAVSGAVTIAGSPAVDQLTYFQLARNADSGSDTFTGDARVLGIKIFFTTDAANDA